MFGTNANESKYTFAALKPSTNNENGDCAIEGTVSPSVFIISDFELEYTWTYTNICNGNQLVCCDDVTYIICRGCDTSVLS